MRHTSHSLPRSLAALAAAIALGACATPDAGTDHAAHHPDQRAGSPAAGATMAPGPGGAMMGSGMMGGAQSGGAMRAGQMDKDAMCAMYREMHGATAQQRQSMMEQHMKGMSHEMRQQHMEMMRQHCK
ncbi:hypothetical protein ACFSQU_20650 [Massilia sp. GCM10020059]|uniref:Uncharacterized protein n=1 Tax=Massilia agrisoli TaxID=2892444 RepID=A0ABS8IU33_9BURK|nr:hypothetical protein [Massilia agrisoli]MCC6071946.1 hypothetical protein [Massilia agrisoli]